MLHRTRQLFIRQQTSVINAIRAHMAEFGIVAPVGRKGVEQLLAVVTKAEDQRVPELARAIFLARLGLDLYSQGPRIDRWSSRRASSGSRFHLLPFPGGPQRLHVMHPVRCPLS
jgi:hypothetical protein